MGKKRATAGPAASRPQRHLVFISHASYDKWIAEIIREKLEAPETGASTFIDNRDIDGGDSIPQAIMQAIKACDEVVVLFTPESLKRSWVTMEVGMAAIQEKRIVPLLYHVRAEEMHDMLRNTKAYDLNDLAEYLSAVRKRVQGK